MRCAYCGQELGDATECVRCGSERGSRPATGWRPDPTARHEGRYYSVGRPTDRVRNGRREASDPDGGRMLPEFVSLPRPRSSSLGTAGAVIVIVLLAGVMWILFRPKPVPEPPDVHYLTTLRDSGLTDRFNSDANAVAHGHSVCRQLDDGGAQQGVPADKIAVDAFCPQFAKGFHVLETATVTGTFVLTDAMTDAYVRSIDVDGSTCTGADGYSDVNPRTEVTVRNDKGEILTTTMLGPGQGDTATCTFTFTFPITEGSDRYVVSVGRRGEFTYSFAQLQRQGLRVHLGH